MSWYPKLTWHPIGYMLFWVMIIAVVCFLYKLYWDNR